MRRLSGYATLSFSGRPIQSIEHQIQAEQETLVLAAGEDFYGTGWRMIFLINVPLGLGAIAAGLKLLPAGRGSVRLAARSGIALTFVTIFLLPRRSISGAH